MLLGVRDLFCGVGEVRKELLNDVSVGWITGATIVDGAAITEGKSLPQDTQTFWQRAHSEQYFHSADLLICLHPDAPMLVQVPEKKPISLPRQSVQRDIIMYNYIITFYRDE